MHKKGVTDMIIYNNKTMELEFGPEEGSEESIKISQCPAQGYSLLNIDKHDIEFKIPNGIDLSGYIIDLASSELRADIMLERRTVRIKGELLFNADALMTINFCKYRDSISMLITICLLNTGEYQAVTVYDVKGSSEIVID